MAHGARVTFPFVTRRTRKAMKSHSAILRVGHPLIEGLERLLRSDDRGRTFAFDATDGAGEVAAYFRFDFLLTPDADDESAVMRRRLDEVMPPDYFSFWLSADGGVVTGRLESDLTRIVTVGEAPTVRSERWEQLLARLPFDWPETVQERNDQAHDVAKTLTDAGNSGGWQGWVGRALDRIDDSAAAVRLLRAARGAAGVEEEADASVNAEFGFLDRMKELAEASLPRTESMGVVFYPSQDPLG